MIPSILLIDDNQDFLDLLQSALSTSGFSVRTAASGEEGLAALRDSCPDLVILDVQMNGLGGPEVLDRIEQEQGGVLKKTKILFSSAGKPPPDPRVCGFIDKMTDIGEYKKQIERYLGWREPPVAA